MGQSDSKLSQYREHTFQLTGPDLIPLYSPTALPRDIIKCYNDPLSWTAAGGDEQELFSSVFREFSASNADARDVFSVVSSQELRFIFQSNKNNFTTLVCFLALKIHILTCLLQQCNQVSEFRSRKSQLLTCVRILTKILPVFFEMDPTQQLEDSLFWNQDSSQVLKCDELPAPVSVPKLNVNHISVESQDLVPLGVTLLQACVKLLFMQGFTLPLSSPHPQEVGKIAFLLWENGINTNETTYTPPNPKLDSNRLEVLRLLITLSSKELYADRISKFLVVMTTSLPEFHIICLSSSILNLVCRSCRNNNDDNGLTYPPNSYQNVSRNSNPRALRKALVAASVQLLNISLLCPVEGPNQSKIYEFLYGLNLYSTSYTINNLVKSYLGSLNREFDLKFVLVNLVTLLKRPMDQAIESEANPFSLLNSSTSAATKQTGSHGKVNGHSRSGSIKNGSQNSSLPRLPGLILQIVILLWELIKCNRAFENYVADKYANKLLLICIYYIKYYSNITTWRTNLIPVISAFATYLSSKKLVMSKMLYCFNVNYYTNKLPNFYKISTGDITRLTYRDFAVIQLSNLALTQVHENLIVDGTLVELIYNLLPMSQELTSGDLVQLSSDRSNRISTLSYNACVVLLQLLSKMTNKHYLTTFAGESSGNNSPPSSKNASDLDENNENKKPYALSPGFKLDLLALFLQAFNNCIISGYEDSKHLLFVVSRHAKVVERLDEILGQISTEIENNSEDENSQPTLNSGLNINDYFDDTVAYDIRLQRPNQNLTSLSDSDYSLMEKAQLQSLMIFVPNSEKPEDVEAAAERIAIRSPNKTVELYEHSDKDFDAILDSSALLMALRPTRPTGLAFKKKLKAKMDTPLNQSWLGTHALSTLISIIEVVNKKFPELSKISTSNYASFLKTLVSFEPVLKKELLLEIPNETGPLLVKWHSNELASRWYRSVLWADIFDHNSVPFISAFAQEASSQDTFQSNHQNLSQPATPKLERWNSQGSALSRTNSNSSSINTLFLHQDPEPASNSAPNSPSVGSGFSNWLNNKYQAGSQGSERSSLFRFSWTGFQKSHQEGKIDEEFDSESSSDAISRGKVYSFDPGLLKCNIWVGTHIRLFKTKVDERENSSLMEMTSNFLRKLRLGSNPSLNSPDGILVTPGTLTPGTARSWTPRNSLASNGLVSTARAHNSGLKY